MMISCYDYAIKYLSRYPKSVYELGKQLQKKGYEEIDIADTTQRLQDLGFLDDKLYTDMYIHSEILRKGKPLYVVKQKLRQKGISRDIIEHVCMEYEEELLVGQRKKIHKEIIRLKNKHTEETKIIQKLQSRGYSYADIRYVMEKHDREDEKG